MHADPGHCCQQPLLPRNIKLGNSQVRLHHELLAVAGDVVRLQQDAILAQIAFSFTLCFEAWWPNEGLLHPCEIRVPILKLCKHLSSQMPALMTMQKASKRNMPADPNTACCTAASNFAMSTVATPALHDKKSVNGLSDMTRHSYTQNAAQPAAAHPISQHSQCALTIDQQVMSIWALLGLHCHLMHRLSLCVHSLLSTKPICMKKH